MFCPYNFVLISQNSNELSYMDITSGSTPSTNTVTNSWTKLFFSFVRELSNQTITSAYYSPAHHRSCLLSMKQSQHRPCWLKFCVNLQKRLDTAQYVRLLIWLFRHLASGLRLPNQRKNGTVPPLLWLSQWNTSTEEPNREFETKKFPVGVELLVERVFKIFQKLWVCMFLVRLFRTLVWRFLP